MYSFLCKNTFRSTGTMSDVCIDDICVFCVNHRDEKSHPLSAADAMFLYKRTLSAVDKKEVWESGSEVGGGGGGGGNTSACLYLEAIEELENFVW